MGTGNRNRTRNQGSGNFGRTILAALLPLLLTLAAGPGCGGPRPTADNAGIRSVLLISIDTLRADHLSCYGYPRETSPRIDDFLAEGTIFLNAQATSSRTAPSHVSLMTGLYPSFTTVDVENGMYPLSDEATTLAECARAAGVRTAAVVSNPVLSRRLNLDQGFEIYLDNFPRAVAGRGQSERIASDTVGTAMELIQRFKGERFFIWVHIQDPHGPYSAPGDDRLGPGPQAGADPGIRLPPGEGHSGYQSIPRYQLLGSEFRLSEYIRRYDEEIRYFDQELGKLFDYLEQEKLLNETLVALTADHGEAFGEDEFYCAHGHGSGLDQTRVPLGLVGPGIARGMTHHTALSTIDLFSTILEALGLENPEQVQSRSLLEALRSGEKPARRVGFTESATQRAAFTGELHIRRDRYPLEDEAFWNSANPYTGAPHIPLGHTRWIRLGETPIQERKFTQTEQRSPALEELSRELARFSDRADQASKGLADVRRNRYDRPLGGDEEAQLRALGYME